MRTRTTFVACVAALATALFSTGARAEDVAAIKARFPACKDASPPPSDVDSARSAHEAAMKAFDGARYREAIERWTEAYAHDCTRPKIFLNMGNAHERDADKRGALAMYELYVERNPSDVPDNLPTRIEGLRAAVAEEDAALAKKESEARAKPVAPPPPTETEKPLGVAPWIIVGVGGAAVVAGAVLVPLGLSQAGSASDECADPASRTGCPSTAIDDGEGGELMSQLGQGLLYGGAGVAAVGLVLELAMNGERPVEQAPSPQARLVGGPAAGGAFVGVQGSF